MKLISPSRRPNQWLPRNNIWENVSTLFMFVFMMYFAEMSLFPELSFIVPGWAALLFFLITFCRGGSILPFLLLSIGLLLFYLLGNILSNDRMSDLVYLRTLLTCFVFSAALYSILRNNIRNFKNLKLSFFNNDQFHFLVIVFLSVWSIGIIIRLNSAVIADFRDITGDSYLTLSDLFALFILAYLSHEYRSRIIFWSVFLFSLPPLVLFGSRTTMILYPAAVVVLVASRFSVKTALFALVAICVGGFMYINDVASTHLSSTRRLATLVNLDGDASLSAREHLVEKMLTQVTSDPSCLLFGCQPHAGSYVHSILSLVQYFGVAGLILLCVTGFQLIIKRRYFIKQRYFPILLFVVAALVFSRSWVSPLFPVAIALIFDGTRWGNAGKLVLR